MDSGFVKGENEENEVLLTQYDIRLCRMIYFCEI